MSGEASVNCGWINWRAECVSHVCCQVSADFFPLYLKDITFRCCSSVVFRPFLLSSPCPVSWFFLRKLFSKVFIALWGITLLINKYSFIPVKLCYCRHFSYIQLKKGEQILCFCVRLLVTKCLKIEYISGSLLSCLLYVDNSLVHHLIYAAFMLEC